MKKKLKIKKKLNLTAMDFFNYIIIKMFILSHITIKKYLLISKLARKNRKIYILVKLYTLDKQHLLISNEANLK